MPLDNLVNDLPCKEHEPLRFLLGERSFVGETGTQYVLGNEVIRPRPT